MAKYGNGPQFLLASKSRYPGGLVREPGSFTSVLHPPRSINAGGVRVPEPVGVHKTMEDAETLYEKRELERARAMYTRILQESDEKPLHAKSYYGLARIAILQKDPELAERLFHKSLESSPEPYVKAWVLVYLGKLAHASGDEPGAVARFKEAMAVEGASRAARGEAEKGIAVK